jgi:hypothetical protein
MIFLKIKTSRNKQIEEEDNYKPSQNLFSFTFNFKRINYK